MTRAPKGNQVDIDGDVAYVKLTRGRVTVIDATDVPLLACGTWQAEYDDRAAGDVATCRLSVNRPGSNGHARRLMLHRHILGLDDAGHSVLVEHRDEDTLNNRRANLAVVERTRGPRNHQTGSRKYNEITVDGDVAHIQLKGLVVTVVDATDVDRVSERTWTPCWNESAKEYYVLTHRLKSDPEDWPSTIFLHRYLLEDQLDGVRRLPGGYVVDHKDHNPLNNRRSNLRIVTNQQNCQYRRGIDARSTTRVRGVSIHTTSNGKKYYVAKVSVARYFPFTDEGLEQAGETVLDLRQQLAKLDLDLERPGVETAEEYAVLIGDN